MTRKPFNAEEFAKTFWGKCLKEWQQLLDRIVAECHPTAYFMGPSKYAPALYDPVTGEVKVWDEGDIKPTQEEAELRAAEIKRRGLEAYLNKQPRLVPYVRIKDV